MRQRGHIRHLHQQAGRPEARLQGPQPALLPGRLLDHFVAEVQRISQCRPQRLVRLTV